MPALVALAVSTAAAAESTTVRVADLAWLAGDWQGVLANGATFEAHYTDPAGGVILSVSKEQRDGRAVFFEFEHFGEKDGVVVYTPRPNGAERPGFPLVHYDADAKRAVFENPAHDFPQRFTFARTAPDRLVITLSGPGKDGGRKDIVFDLRRVKE